MSYVSQRSSTTYPEWTNNSKKYYYQFIQVPNSPWSASAPASTVTIDGDIMPKRDVNDAANGTDTWKILRGVDMYFAYEGAYERWTASNQFYTIDWPRSTWYDNINRPYILSRPWQWAQGNVPQYSKTGLANCYQAMWLKGIQSTSDLQSKYTTWANGQTITPSNVPGSDRGGVWSYYLDYAIGKWELSDMVSNYEDFASGSPFVADNVRRLYYDMSRLKWYSPHAGDGSGDRSVSISTTQWQKLSWSNVVGFSPDAPTTANLVQYQARQVFNYGEPDEHGGYWGWKPTAGQYYFPRPGKIDNNGNRTDFMGDVVACYVALHLTQTGDNISQRDIYEWRKVPHTLTSDGWVKVEANQMSDAAFQMINDNNANVPQVMGEDDVFTVVYCNHINLVCQLGDRTDISQIGWNWAP